MLESVPEYAHRGEQRFGYGTVVLGWQHFDHRACESRSIDAPFKNAESAHAACENRKHAELLHIPLLDAGRAADVLGNRRRADLAAFPDQAYAERGPVLQASLGHAEVALFEQAQGQRACGKQHDIEREDRYRRYGRGGHDSRLQYQVVSPARASPRCRTRTVLRSRKAAASLSAR